MKSIKKKAIQKQNKSNESSRSELQHEISVYQVKYVCSHCKGIGHNARSYKLKKKEITR
jgi:hypothetical protein